MTSKLVAIVYPEMHRAEEVLGALKRLQNEYLIDLEDAAYVTKDAKGKMVHRGDRRFKKQLRSPSQ